MLTIILDTNFLLLPFTRGIDILSEIDRIIDMPYKVGVLQQSKAELLALIEHAKGKQRIELKSALKLLDKLVILKQKDLNMNAVSNDGIVDDILVGVADNSTIVATQDRALKRRLQYKDIRIITTKGRKLHVL